MIHFFLIIPSLIIILHLFSGLWAVINTADVCLRGRIEMQESAQWETLFKTNVFGTLKTARTFYPLLLSQKGEHLTRYSYTLTLILEINIVWVKLCKKYLCLVNKLKLAVLF
jgi:NAD(P)-dependent dehydrogenase (short-subunit alcohol dehydrogenase family)